MKRTSPLRESLRQSLEDILRRDTTCETSTAGYARHIAQARPYVATSPPSFHRKTRREGLPRSRERLRTRCRGWLPFVDTYRTLCLSPPPELRKVLAELAS